MPTARDAAQPDPIAEMVRIVTRTLWILFAGFAFAVIAYFVLFLLTRSGESTLEALRQVDRPAHWEQWQFFFVALGLAAVYVSRRLRGRLLGVERIRRTAQRSARAATAGSAARGEALGRVFQDVVARIIVGHVILWGLVEIPAVLGVVDRMVSGEARYFLVLILLTAFGLYLHRPSPARIAGLLRSLWNTSG